MHDSIPGESYSLDKVDRVYPLKTVGKYEEGSIFFMKKTLFFCAIAVAILFVMLGVYYLIPGVYHVVGNGGRDSATMHPHRIYAGTFFVLAVIGMAVAFISRPQKA